MASTGRSLRLIKASAVDPRSTPSALWPRDPITMMTGVAAPREVENRLDRLTSDGQLPHAGHTPMKSFSLTLDSTPTMRTFIPALEDHGWLKSSLTSAQ